MIKVALFDLDGVVIKDPIFSTVYAAEFGLKPEDMLPFFSKAFIRCSIGESDLRQALIPYLNDWKWTKTVDELVTYWLTHHQNVDHDVLKVVNALRAKGIKTGLQTNQEKNRSDYVWNTLGFKNSFDFQFVSHELGARKPQTTFFIKILQALKPIQADEILFIDDSMNNIAVAKNFGFKTHFFTNLESLRQLISTLWNIKLYNHFGNSLPLLAYLPWSSWAWHQLSFSRSFACHYG